MNPQEQFCPNFACPSRGQRGEGNIAIHSQKEQRYRCSVCRKTFSATTGTARYRLRKDGPICIDLLPVVVSLLALGCPVSAIEAVFDLDARTVASWQERAGKQAQQIHVHLITSSARDLGQVQADEMRIRTQKGILWMAMALGVRSRLWLGGVVSAHRDKNLIAALATLVRRCADACPLLITFDGLSCYPGCFLRAFRRPRKTGKRGRPSLIVCPQLCLGQVVKQKKNGYVTGVVCRLVRGTEEALTPLLLRANQINTAYIERINATFRQHLAALARRSRSLVRLQPTLETSMYLAGGVYNFCTPHQSLEGQTPAMAAGVTQHRWTVAELLEYQVPPAFWQPPRTRGRQSKAIKQLCERWLKTNTI